jgi:transcriptional regulator MraZ
VFFGEHRHALDAKGRVSLPQDFRDQLTGTCVLTKGRDDCILGFSPDEWEAVTNELSALPASQPEVRVVQRHFFGSAAVLKIDAQGRVLVPQALREFADLDREVVFAGSGAGKFEVWDRARFDAAAQTRDALANTTLVTRI